MILMGVKQSLARVVFSCGMWGDFMILRVKYRPLVMLGLVLVQWHCYKHCTFIFSILVTDAEADMGPVDIPSTQSESCHNLLGNGGVGNSCHQSGQQIQKELTETATAGKYKRQLHWLSLTLLRSYNVYFVTWTFTSSTMITSNDAYLDPEPTLNQ